MDAKLLPDWLRARVNKAFDADEVGFRITITMAGHIADSIASLIAENTQLQAELEKLKAPTYIRTDDIGDC